MIGVSTSLSVSTLGRFEIRRNGEQQAGGNWSRRKVVELFKLLLAAEQHRLHREQVQEILWPNSLAEQATNSFGKTLYLLRRALEPGLTAGKGSSSIYVLLDHDTLMLVPDSMEIDADIFESSAKQLQSRIRSAAPSDENARLLEDFDNILALYQGDFLPEELYEDWTQRRRDRLRRIHSSLLERAAELALATGKGLRASEYLLELLERNSADEQTHRQLMLLYARMGRRSDALNQYLLLRRTLKEELHTAPLPETNELFRRIQMGQIPVDLHESWLDDRTPSSTTATIVTPADSVSTLAEAGGPGKAGNGPLSPPSFIAEERKSDPDTHSGRLQGPPSYAPTAPAPTGMATQSEEVESARQLDPERILKAELVGRKEELNRMQRAFQQACNGQHKVIFVSGEPGIGKSRLARDFTAWGEQAQQATVLWGYCYEMSGSLPYQPIADAITTHVRICSPEKLRAILGNSAADLAKIAPEIGYKLPNLPQPEPMGAEADRRNLYNAAARYFNMLAAESPFILILDDLQWADAATLHLLNFLTLQHLERGQQENTGLPLYLLLYRPDEVHEAHPLRALIATLLRVGTGEELRLQRLSEEEVHQLLVNMAGHPVGLNFASEVFRQTEGNPFFIGEAIRSLVLEGKIKWIGDRWQSTVEVSALEIPHSVRMLIERRLVHLPADCRTTLTIAAVIGRQFSSTLLCQTRNLAEDAVAEHIDTAIQLQLVASLTGFSNAQQGSNSYPARQDADLTFTHDKIREVLYQWLNPLRRRSLHRQVAQAIESSHAAHLQPYYSTLAYHYSMAEDATRAVDFLLKASYQAVSVYAFADAASALEKALDLLVGDGERVRRAGLLHQLANIYLYLGRTDDAIQAGLASSTLWRDLGDPARQAAGYLDVAFFSHWQGRELEALKYISSALKCLASRPEETTLLVKAYTQWGLAATVMGDVPQALKMLQRADELLARIDDSLESPANASTFSAAERREHLAFIAVVSLWSKSWCAYLSDTPQQMLAYAMQGAEMCQKYNKPDWEPMMTYSAAWAYMQLGQIPQGEQTAGDALEKAQRHGVYGAAGWADLVLDFLAIQAGRWDDARLMGEKASAIATMIHDADLQSRVLWSYSVCAGWQGDWEQAIADALKALEVAKEEGETSMVYPHLLVQAAKAYLYANKPEQAQACLNEGMQLAAQRNYRQLIGIGQRLQGRILQAQGHFEEALPYFEQSLAGLLAIDDVVELARTEEAYGLFYLERQQEGDQERGEELIQSARATFRRLGVNG
ncbi:MAG TPA: AAA family ATPase [Ktedonobacteraceae bacterium]|nr:AAA family ATPase [Ktedonobacteraceae bacterium]